MRFLRFIMLSALFTLALAISASAQVTVNPGATNYTTLGGAFNAINAGTHTGAITIDITASFTETANTSAVLNSSGAGAASYTSILIRPTVDGVTMTGTGGTGAACGGKGLIELNGADNVTIDGDNPNTGGTNRNLTITDTCIGTFAQVIRIALNTTDTISADNVTIRNLAINGSAPGRNITAANSTAGTENTTYGIYASGSAATATTTPTTIASTTTTIGTGATASNLTITNNSINSTARGIAIQGSATTVFPGLLINNNTVGNATAGAVDQVYSLGITAQGSANGIIRGNTVYVEWFVGTQNRAIDIGSISLVGSFTVEKNNVARVRNNSTGTFGAYGINLAGGSPHIVRNNFVSDIKHDMTGGVAFSTTFGVFGIRIASGTGHQIYNNSVNLFGTYTGTATASLLSAALCIVSTGQTGMDVRNNILANTHSSGTTSIAHVSLFLPPSGTSAMNLTLNNNDYFTGTDLARNGIAHVGTTYTAVPAGPATYAGLYPTASFNAGSTSPTSNLRAYTSILNAAGTNDNASIVSDPTFVSTTDLHIPGTSPAVNAGATIATVTDDIDGDARPIGGAYEIGADERAGLALPGTLQLSSATYGGNEGTTLAATVNRVLGTSGAVGVTYTLTDVTATGGAACGVGVDYVNPGPQLLSFADSVASQPINVTLCTDAVTDPSETFTITLSAPTGGAILGVPTVATVTITDIPPPFAGTYTVGGGGNYPSLTNPGGIFEALNLAGASGPVTINITSDLTGETGTVALNELASGQPVLIKPSGAPRTITGSSATAIIRLNGADNIRIDGSTAASLVDGFKQDGGDTDSLVGGNPALRELTIENTNVGTSSSVILVGTGTNGAQNNILRNLNVDGNAGTTTIVGISLGGNTVGTTGADNDNNTVRNCRVRRAVFGIYSAGTSLANQNTGTRIEENQLDATAVADRIGRVGIILFNDSGALISENSVGGILSSAGADAVGIGLGVGTADAQFSNTAVASGGITNAVVTRNRISGVANDNTWGAAGIAVAGDANGPNTIFNNLITGVISDATSPDIVAGIFVAGVTASTTRLYYNSISMTGDRSALATPGTGQQPSYGIAITGADPNVELINNVFYTTQTAEIVANPSARSYAIGMFTTTFVNLNSNFNDFWSTGAQDGGFRTGSLAAAAGTDQAALAGWQTVTGGTPTDDANSLEVDPLFVDPLSDAHLQATSPVRNVGSPIAGITVDHDGQTRPNPGDPLVVQVDMGGDEFFAPLAANASISGRVSAADGNGIRNAVITLAGGNLPQPRVIRTTTFGYYTFEDLEVGETYVLTVNSKRFTFSVPSRVITLNDNVEDADFTADGK